MTRYASYVRTSTDRSASRVVIHAYEFRTADDKPVYYAVANTNELAHTDQEKLIDAVVEATEELFEDGELSPSVAGMFATDLFHYGIVDVEATEQKLARKAEETVDHELSTNNGQVEIETMHDELERFPEPIWRHRVQYRLRRGELRRRNGYYLSV